MLVPRRRGVLDPRRALACVGWSYAAKTNLYPADPFGLTMMLHTHRRRGSKEMRPFSHSAFGPCRCHGSSSTLECTLPGNAGQLDPMNQAVPRGDPIQLVTPLAAQILQVSRPSWRIATTPAIACVLTLRRMSSCRNRSHREPFADTTGQLHFPFEIAAFAMLTGSCQHGREHCLPEEAPSPVASGRFRLACR